VPGRFYTSEDGKHKGVVEGKTEGGGAADGAQQVEGEDACVASYAAYICY
jgi:hypothetical protein